MRPRSWKTELRDREALRLALALGVLLAIGGAIRAITIRSVPVFAVSGAGVVLVVMRVLIPRIVLPTARRLLGLLEALGEGIGTVVLTAIYLLLVWPYQRFLRLLGLLEPPEEPWPPPDGATGWVPLGWGSSVPVVRQRAVAGSLLARLLVRAGAALSLLAFLRRRPSFFLIPLVSLLLLLSLIHI